MINLNLIMDFDLTYLKHKGSLAVLGFSIIKNGPVMKVHSGY